MRNRRILPLSFALMFFACGNTAYASESDALLGNTAAPEYIQESSLLGEQFVLGVNMDDVFQNMMQSLNTGTDISFSECFNSFTTGFSLSSEPLFDTTAMTALVSDFGSTNLIFQQMQESLQNGFGDVITHFNDSTDCVSLFENTYGPSSDYLSLPDLSASFDVNDMLNSSYRDMTAAYNSAASSDAFKQTESYLSMSDVFSMADANADERELGSYEDLMHDPAFIKAKITSKHLAGSYGDIYMKEAEKENDAAYINNAAMVMNSYMEAYNTGKNR